MNQTIQIVETENTTPIATKLKFVWEHNQNLKL